MKQNIHVTLLIFIGVALVIFINNTFAPIYFFSGLVQHIFSTPKSAFYNTKVFATSKLNPEDPEISKLKQENQKLLEQLVDYSTLKKENESLRSQLENENVKTQSTTSAHVIGFSGKYDAPDILVIDKGSDDGVKKGNAVVVGKYLVGMVSETSKSYSRVIVSLHKDFSIVAKTLKTNAIGVLKGEEDFIIFDKVAITDMLQKDDIVLTKGDMDVSGNGIPADLIIGKIVSVNKVENKPFQNAKVQSVVDYARIETVFVIIP